MDEVTQALNYEYEIISQLHDHLHSVNRFPHEGQFPVLQAFFDLNKKVLMGQCGRSHGKTEEILYITWRYALTHPNTETYIVCPEVKQARKIYWFKRRLQTYGPAKFVTDIRESENRVVFFNNSYIMIDGCENYEALRGIKPNLVVYDEFQHHSNLFDEEVMQPNLAAGNVNLVVMGTPPKRQCYYVEFREKILAHIKKGNPKYFYVELPTSANPMQDKAWLKEKKQELVDQGKLNVWLREYEGKLVFDVDGAIFPQFSKEGPKNCVYSHKYLMNLIKPDKKKLEWYAMYDPGTSTCFAVLFVAINRYTAQMFFLDEIYEKRKEETLASRIWPKSEAMKKELYDDLEDWQNYYDEAAPSFALDVQDRYDANIQKTQKAKRANKQDSRPGEDLIKMLFDEGKIFISDRCEKFIWELENYIMVDGKYPKSHDHCIDLLHYTVIESRIALDEQPDEKEIEERRNTGEDVHIQHPLSQELKRRDILSGVEEAYDNDYDMDIV